MFSVRILLVLSFAVGFSTSDDDDDVAYVKYNLPSVECTDIPDGSLCPLDYEIPDYTEDDKDDDGNPEKPAYNETEIRIRLDAVFSRLNSSGANQMCKDASRDFECSKMLPVCDDDDDYIRESGKKASEYCEEGKRKCASLSRVVLDEMFNCTSVGQETKTRARRGVCEDFPDVDDDPYPCAKRNYKVRIALLCRSCLNSPSKILPKVTTRQCLEYSFSTTSIVSTTLCVKFLRGDCRRGRTTT